MKATRCPSCGTEPRAGARFCDVCGSLLQLGSEHAEYKQVTVLFADVVHSMKLAAEVGAERLREIMTELVNRASTVVQQWGGTVDQFTGDGIMAVFGAPLALEDHAFRACLASLGIQDEVKKLSAEVLRRDGVDLMLRVGLNSGQIVAGEITGPTPFGYTAIGEQVGIAQRMESVAPPGGVMLSESTARLVETAALLAESEIVHIKGTDTPVSARRLLDVFGGRGRAVRMNSSLVGRQGELAILLGALERAVEGNGCIASVTGSAGIGKSRLVTELVRNAASRGFSVSTAFCESHTTEIPFHVVTNLLRATSGIADLDDEAARAKVRAGVTAADPQDLLLLDDLLGIGDATVPQPLIDPDERRRRLTSLISSTMLTGVVPAVYVVEDAHWIDPISESLIADVLGGIPRTRALALVTYRPEYRGLLARLSASQTISLGPLDPSQTEALTAELLGPHPSVARLAAQIAERAAGNPFFAQEIVRELAERGVLDGGPGQYLCRNRIGDISVPVTLQATIASRIDRLGRAAKRALGAASVIGSRFDPDLLSRLGVDPVFDELVAAELVDQVRVTPVEEYAFRHPLIRAVAYESQLKADRAEWHRRVANAIEARGSPDEDAALIAEHLEGSGALEAAFSWYMRAGTWTSYRDVDAAHMSWQRAERLARAAFERSGDLQSAGLLSRALLWQGHPVQADEILARFVPEDLDEMQLLHWGIPRIAMLFWSMADVTRAHDILALLRERVQHPRAALIVESIGAAMAVHENEIAAGLGAVERVLSHPQAPAAAIDFAAFAAGLAMPLTGRGRGFGPIAARCLTEETFADSMIRTMVRYCDVLALASTGELDTAEKRAADYADSSSAGQFLPWAIAKIMAGLLATHRGKFLDAATALESAVATLTEEASLPWRLPARLLLARAYAALGRADEAGRVLAEAAEHSGRFVAIYTPQLMIAKSSLAAARGLESRAVEIARAAADVARDSGQLAVEAEALHQAARFGDRTVARRLDQLSRIVDGDVVTLQAAHAAAVATADAIALDAVSLQFENATILLSAADSAAQAATVKHRLGERAESEQFGARALRLAAECGGAVTPAIRRVMRPVVP